MTVAALSTGSLSQYVLTSSSLSQSQQAWQSLQSNLASGNLTAAQSAFNTYQQINKNLTAMSGGASTTSSAVTTDLTALGTALNSGSLSSAQQAFATLQTDMKGTQSQALTSAMTAVAQTVQWVDDMLNISGSSSASTSTDLGTAVLQAADGLKSASSASADPTAQILNSAYGVSTGSSGDTSSASSTVSSSSGTTVNAYA